MKKDEEGRRKKGGLKTTFLSRTVSLKTGNEMDKRWSWDKSKKRRENAFTLFLPCHCSFCSFSCCKQCEPRAFCLNYDQKVGTSKKGGCKKIVCHKEWILPLFFFILSSCLSSSHSLRWKQGGRENHIIAMQDFFSSSSMNGVQNVKL